MWNRARLLLWWLPALLAALVAGIMPDTFLDSPYTTIPHEAAFAIRFWLVMGAFVYIPLVLLLRLCLHLARRFGGEDDRTLLGFPVIPVPTPRGPRQ
jgi:hypothetical protein